MTRHVPPMSGLHFVGEDDDGNPIWSGSPPSTDTSEPALSSETKPTVRVECSHSLMPETAQLLSQIGRDQDRGSA